MDANLPEDVVETPTGRRTTQGELIASTRRIKHVKVDDLESKQPRLPAGVLVRNAINDFCHRGVQPGRLSEIANSASRKPYERIAARRLLEAATKGNKGMKEAEFICDQTAGKPKETIDHAITDSGSITSRLSAIKDRLDPTSN